ncbi:hypothetical protein [Desulfomicrobium salsuginis]
MKIAAMETMRKIMHEWQFWSPLFTTTKTVSASTLYEQMSALITTNLCLGEWS